MFSILLAAAAANADLAPSVEAWLARAATGDRVAVWVFLRDKGPLSAAAVETQTARLARRYDPRAVERRRRARPTKPFDYDDLPVYKPYVDALEAEGVDFRGFSRWLNAVSIEATPAQILTIETMPFVRLVRRVAGRRGGPLPETRPARVDATGRLDQYGPSWRQLETIQAIDLHGQGFTGNGVRIAIFDTGFWLEHQCLQSINLIAQYDFINGDGETANQPGDPENQHRHGTQCLSLLTGFMPGTLVGAAYDAEYILAKTEDVSMEEPVEEDWWIQAAEWADSLGAQVISSSLCYNDWYTYEDMDGDTAPITNAADHAVLIGIVVLNAAGNSGASSWKYVLAPADGDSVITVGSVDSTGLRSYWSSVGPTYDGRIKPTVMAMGQDTYIADPDFVDDYRLGSGTSFATPLAAGAVALILEKNPTWLPADVMEAVTATATRASDPDTLYGWGILQALDASDHVPLSGIAAAESHRRVFLTYPNPCGGRFHISPVAGRLPVEAILVYDVTGRFLGRVEPEPGNALSFDITSLLGDAGTATVFVRIPGSSAAKVLLAR